MSERWRRQWCRACRLALAGFLILVPAFKIDAVADEFVEYAGMFRGVAPPRSFEPVQQRYARVVREIEEIVNEHRGDILRALELVSGDGDLRDTIMKILEYWSLARRGMHNAIDNYDIYDEAMDELIALASEYAGECGVPVGSILGHEDIEEIVRNLEAVIREACQRA